MNKEDLKLLDKLVDLKDKYEKALKEVVKTLKNSEKLPTTLKAMSIAQKALKDE